MAKNATKPIGAARNSLAGTWSARCIAAIVCLFSGSAYPETTLHLAGLATSPNGRVVAFGLTTGTPAANRRDVSKSYGLGLYDWESGKVTRIPNPPGQQLGEPQFSYDGKTLAVGIARRGALSWSDIGVIDLGTLRVTRLTQTPQNGHSRDVPVFQPGADNILYTEKGLGAALQIKILNTRDASERVVWGEWGRDFLIAGNFSFVGAETIFFHGVAPRDPKLVGQLKALGLRPTDSAIYRLRFGAAPEILFPEVERRLRTISLGNELLSPSASRDGETLVAAALNLAAPVTKGHGFNWEIFRIDRDGQLAQLTNLRSVIAWVSIAYDGSVVAFASDAERDRDPLGHAPFDLWILDMRTQRTIETELLRKLKSDPNFTSP